MLRTSRIFKVVVGATAVAALSLPLAACSSSDAADSGNSKPSPAAKIDNLSGDSTQVTLDQGFVDALTSLKLTPGVVGDATLADGAVTFPITGGNVTYYKPGSIDPYVQGLIEHDGSGLSLTAGATKVELTNFEVDPGSSKLFGDVLVNGKEAAPHAQLFNLDGRTLKPLQTGPNNTAILAGTKVTISADAAGLLNQTFKTDAVKAGLLVGVAKITVNTK
ncbi:MAG: hypothetical protein H0U61_03195 [Nocardioidaceae bacterium]|nr:hypothetical protein [Nocardioidaceae bacterium]